MRQEAGVGWPLSGGNKKKAGGRRQAGQYQEAQGTRKEAGWPVSGGKRKEAGGRLTSIRITTVLGLHPCW